MKLQDSEITVQDKYEFRIQRQPPENPEGGDFIPEPKPQVPFHQVEPNAPGKDLAPGSTIPWVNGTEEPKEPREDISYLLSTLAGKEYNDPDPEEPQGAPMSELWGKGRKGPRPGQPTYPPTEPKPDRTPPEKPKPNPNPKSRPWN